jgi:uncharacterized protein YidB (DUF937 family)
VGLIDVLNGMQNGPRGARGPSTGSSSGGGMSPLTMAILGLLAYKAFKSFTSQPGTATSTPTGPAPTQAGGAGGLGDILKNVLGGEPGPAQAGAPGGSGGLNDLLKGGLGGLLAGGAAGSVLSGGLNDLLKQLQEAGQGDVAKSWVGTGPNKTISPNDLADALGSDQIRALSTHSGMSQEDLLEGLSQYLPQVVDHLTPNGRVPTDQEISRSL